jgi:hypothetical protein
MALKKNPKIRARKVNSKGLWIAPDLERKIKGEGGRRGLSEPPYGYYLQLADLVLKPSSHLTTPDGRQDQGKRSPGKYAEPPEPYQLEDAILETSTPLFAPPKLPLSKPPKAPPPPKPAKRNAPKAIQSPVRPKLGLPKPPQRGR